MHASDSGSGLSQPKMPRAGKEDLQGRPRKRPEQALVIRALPLDGPARRVPSSCLLRLPPMALPSSDAKYWAPPVVDSFFGKSSIFCTGYSLYTPISNWDFFVGLKLLICAHDRRSGISNCYFNDDVAHARTCSICSACRRGIWSSTRC